MKLDCVLTAVNENDLYLDFVPIFVKSWNKLYPDVDVKIILIAENIPDTLLSYKNNIILFEPIENIDTSFTSQIIRLFYPCILNYENGIMITDIDMMPMNRNYYTENIQSYSNDKFIYYRENACFNTKEIAMCYNIATPKIWKEIFNVNSLEDIKTSIKYIHSKNIKWCTDQQTLYDKVFNWSKQTNNFICLKENETKFKRLDRGDDFDISKSSLRNDIKNGIYSDYHCKCPMSKYANLNYEIYNLL
jgi:hypothetical protein